MTDVAISPAPSPRRPPLDKRMQAAPPDTAVEPARGKTAQFLWLAMADDGKTPPPKDGKWLWLTPDGCGFLNAVEAYWKHTRHFSQLANGGRGGWVAIGFWAFKTPPYTGARIPWQPQGWAPRNGVCDD